MDLAQDAFQRGGYRAFSFRDIADALGIKTAAVHYHFRHKDDLGLALVDRYRDDFFRQLSEADSLETTVEKLRFIARLFKAPLRDDRICLCAATIADSSIVSNPMTEQAGQFIKDLEAWLSPIMAKAGLPDPAGRAEEYLSLLYGGMMVARAKRDPQHLSRVSAAYIAYISSVTGPGS